MTTERAAGAAALAIASALMAMIAPAAPAAWPRYAEREQLACTACHVGPDGGPLTAAGREYRWRLPLLGDADLAGHGALGPRGQLEDAREGDREPSLAGRWSGETSLFARTGGARILGERTRQTFLNESLRLHADGFLADESISFDAEAFSQQGFASRDGGYDDDYVNLSTAAITWRGEKPGSLLRVGRQFLASGAAVRRMDGAYLRAPVSDSLDVDVFGGLPSDNGFGGASGDFLFGGRVGARASSKLSAALSGFYAHDDGDPSDLKAGLDVQLSPWRRLDLFGHLYYDWISDRVYDARVHAVWVPSIEWQVAADWTRAVPGLFLPKNSIFSVFSVDDYEEAGLTLTRRFDADLSARVFGRKTWYDRDGDDLRQIGAGIDKRYGPGGEDLVGAEVAWHEEDRASLGGGSVDGDSAFVRAYHLLWWTAEIYTSIDASLQIVEAATFERDAELIRVLIGWDPRGAWDFEIGFDRLRDPDFERRTDVFARLRTRF